MALDMDDEILQDFLVEAGEILEQLSEQLVDLEQTPEDYDLLNAVFRGFHTIKGGAGFLSIDAMVEVCHRAEDVFNVLRQGQRKVDAVLMDSVLEVLDVVNGMFASVRAGQEPDHATPDLLTRLEHLAVPGGAEEAAPAEVAEPVAAEPEPEAPAAPVQETLSADENIDALLHTASAGLDEGQADGAPDEISEEEFDALLDELHGKGKHGGVPGAESPAEPAPAAASGSDEITEDEFEALLDELHGKGKHGGAPSAGATDAPAQPQPVAEPPAPKAAAPSTPSPSASDEISEEEFDALLDELHGKGKHGGIPKTDDGADAQPKPAAAPAKPAAPPPQGRPAAAAATSKPAATAAAEPAAAPAPPRRPAAPAKAPGAAAPAKMPAGETTVRVDTQRLDDIMNMVGELVLVRNRLATLRASLNDENVEKAVSNLDVVTSDLQIAVMKTRMQPIKKVFGRFPRVVRDLARNLKKEIDLEMEGEETDLDKNLVEALADPLIHLVRNAVDHGIELPDDREKAGKPRKGNVLLSASQEGDHIVLSIKDDGKGMDPEVLRVKAVEKGMMDEESAARLDDKDCYNLIFQPGFSTKTEISDVSGRGVGMDVVKTRITQMNGTVEIDSELGRGSQIIVKLPLTLAILPTLMVVLSEQPFALPLSSVVEIFNLDLTKTNIVDGQTTIMVRQRALPLFYLRQWLVPSKPVDKSRNEGHVVVVNVASRQVGLVVDHLIGQEEVVIKPLGALLHNVDGMAGATITGDGKIALILDLPGLIRRYAIR